MRMVTKASLLVLAFAVIATLVPTVTKADSTLHIGPGAGTACATGCAGEPNLIGSGNIVDIFQTSGGANATLTPPQLLILGIPNDTTNLFASDPITGVTYTNPYPGGTSTAGSSPSITFEGAMQTGQEVYSFLGLSGNEYYSFTNCRVTYVASNGIPTSVNIM